MPNNILLVAKFKTEPSNVAFDSTVTFGALPSKVIKPLLVLPLKVTPEPLELPPPLEAVAIERLLFEST